jgi:hypothetical protein
MARRNTTTDSPIPRSKVKQREKFWLEQDRADLRWLMSDARGRRFIERRLLWALTKFPDDTSNAGLAINLGDRRAALEVWNDAQVECPGEFTAMLQEKSQRVLEDKLALGDLTEGPEPADQRPETPMKSKEDDDA